MGFRRREPLHERLAREGGLGLGAPRPVDTRPWWGEVGIHGVARPREWDAVVTTEADLEGDRAAFVVLPDGTLVIEAGPDDLAQLAEAVEHSLQPPYRAEAVRRRDGAWSVGARKIRVGELPDAPGDELTLTVGEQGKQLVVDGEQRFGSAPELEALLNGARGVVQATRIDGTTFELVVHTL
jgi:hypothetical protein